MKINECVVYDREGNGKKSEKACLKNVDFTNIYLSMLRRTILLVDRPGSL
jgi:hypothetical protein